MVAQHGQSTRQVVASLVQSTRQVVASSVWQEARASTDGETIVLAAEPPVIEKVIGIRFKTYYHKAGFVCDGWTRSQQPPVKVATATGQAHSGHRSAPARPVYSQISTGKACIQTKATPSRLKPGQQPAPATLKEPTAQCQQPALATTVYDASPPPAFAEFRNTATTPPQPKPPTKNK